MQAQFDKDVLGTVRLDEARKHRDKARQLREDGGSRAEMKEEKRLYCEVKRARWILLAGENGLSDDDAASLKKILDDHAGLPIQTITNINSGKSVFLGQRDQCPSDDCFIFDGD